MSESKPKGLRRIITIVVAYACLLIFLFSTDPRKLAVGWLILPFLLLFICLFLSIFYVVDWLRPNQSSNSRKKIISTAVLAALPATMLLLDSVDQLTIRDALLIAVLSVLGMFYINMISLKRNNY
ncbi:MAG: hypothetical protein ACXWLH_02495 [Candidatus Saccharimonadales bacterium]